MRTDRKRLLVKQIADRREKVLAVGFFICIGILLFIFPTVTLGKRISAEVSSLKINVKVSPSTNIEGSLSRRFFRVCVGERER